VEKEKLAFKRTLHEEVFTKKIINPELPIKPEEIPIMSQLLNDDEEAPTPPSALVEVKRESRKRAATSDEEMPTNYFFSGD